MREAGWLALHGAAAWQHVRCHGLSVLPVLAILLCGGRADAQLCPPGLASCTGASTATYPYAPTYQLLGTRGGGGGGGNGAGTAVGPVLGGTYIFSVVGSFGGGAVQLQVLGADGATWQNVGSACTAACTLGVVIGSSAGSSSPNVRAVLSGATAPSIWANLS